jgi:signal transduction histidine kinase
VEEVERIAGRLLLKKLGGVGPGDAGLAPPGPRRIVETVDVLKAEAIEAISRRRVAAERERLAEIGMLAATVAHDLRNPMNIVSMAAAGAPADVRAEIKAQLRRMDALVRDLLDYAKPWRIERGEIDIAALVGALPTAIEADIPSGLTVSADPARLTQALANLIDNAKQAARRVLVAAESDGGAVLVHICDDGPGVPNEIRASLFEPFSTRSQAGTGLGLAIVSKVMAAHGGDVALTQRPGWSTCFTLRFPR